MSVNYPEMAYRLGWAAGDWINYANKMKNIDEMTNALNNAQNLTSDQMAQNIGNFGKNMTVGEIMSNPRLAYSLAASNAVASANPNPSSKENEAKATQTPQVSPKLSTEQMAQNIGNFGKNVNIGELLANPQAANAVANTANAIAGVESPATREEILKANNTLLNENGMPILSAAGNQIMSDKLMYEHYLNQGLPQIAQKYADHANYVREHLNEINGDVPLENYLANGANASYADAQSYLNGDKFYQGLANQALQNTPRDAGQVSPTAPQVQGTAPKVQGGNANAIPTPDQAVAGNGVNYNTPFINNINTDINPYKGGNLGNFLMGRR